MQTLLKLKQTAHDLIMELKMGTLNAKNIQMF